MKNIVEKIFVAIVGVVIPVTFLIYIIGTWVKHPELTQMQLLLNHWKIFLAFFMYMCIGAYFLRDK